MGMKGAYYNELDGYAAQWLRNLIAAGARPVEPGSFPLAHGVPKRASKLRAYGNAIVPQAVQAFIEAVM
jgi:hypothetical protein